MRSCRRFAGAAVILAAVGCMVACATDPRVAAAGGDVTSVRAADASVSPTGSPSVSTVSPTVPTQSAVFTLPSPALVTDLAGVVPDSAKRAIEDTLRMVRRVTEGEIVVVTMSTLPGVTPQQMAQRIGNEWGIGARAGRARQAGSVVLVIPKESSADGRGHCRIELGNGATAFIADSVAAAMCEAAVPFFRLRDYPKGLEVIVDELARRYIKALGAS